MYRKCSNNYKHNYMYMYIAAVLIIHVGLSFELY